MTERTYHVSDLRAEELVCCGSLKSPDLLVRHAPALAPADFYHAAPRALAFVLLPAARVGETLDVRALWLAVADQWFPTWGSAEDAHDYIVHVNNLDPTGAWADAAAARVLYLARRRDAAHEYRRLTRDALAGEGEFAPSCAESLSGLALTEPFDAEA